METRGRRLPKYVPSDQWPKLLNAAVGRQAVRDRALVATLLYTGLRVSELCGLTLACLVQDGKRRRVHVIGKGDKERHVAVTKRLEPILDAYLQVRGDEPGPVFLSEHGGGVSVRQVQRLVSQIGQATGFDWLSPHKLRHSHATALLRKTKRIELVGAQLGHEDLETTRIYAHLLEEDRDEGVDKL